MSYLDQPRDANGRFTKVMAETLGHVALPGEVPAVAFGTNYHTSQIYSQGFEFAFMSDVKGTYQQACTFVYCKDFLHDAVWAAVNKTKWQIYGFKYNSAQDIPLDFDNCVFAFRNTAYKQKPEEFHAAREACQAFLNGIEKQLGFQPSVIYEVPHNDAPCWLIVGDKGWQHAPPMVGLFTLLIRVGFMHKPEDTSKKTLALAKAGKIKIGRSGYAGSNDCSYIASAWEGIQVILKHGLKVFHPKMATNYPQSLGKGSPSLHNSFGPVAFSRKEPKKAMPGWYNDKHWK